MAVLFLFKHVYIRIGLIYGSRDYSLKNNLVFLNFLNEKIRKNIFNFIYDYINSLIRFFSESLNNF